ncbi:MAG: hypothetical protein WCW04_01930, partial [Candidatus Paceibacterota bacterium]
MKRINFKNLSWSAFLSAIFLVFVLVFYARVFASSTPASTPEEFLSSNCPKEEVSCILKTSVSILFKGLATSASITLDNTKIKITRIGESLSNISDNLSSGWSTFTNELLDNSINTLSSHKQFADNLSNNLTRGTLAYTNTVLNIPDQAVRSFSRTKDLGLATTASVGDSLLGASNGISDGWVFFTDTILNNTKQSLTNTKDLAVSIWNNITSIPNTLKNGAETFIATLKGPAPTIPEVTLPRSLVTTSPRSDLGETSTPPTIDPLRPSGTSPEAAGGNTNTGTTIVKNITQAERTTYINQYDPSILPRLQGVELALLNNI